MSRGRILVVDDESTIRQTFRLVLGEEGYEVEEAATGEEGVEKVKQQVFDLVFFDLVLPGIDGIETFRRMTAVRGGLRVVLLTAYFEQLGERLEEVRGVGMSDAFLVKPFGNDEIVRATHRYMTLPKDNPPSEP